MKFIAGETVTVSIGDNRLVIKIEDASKSEAISARVENVEKGADYVSGNIYDFNRNDLTE